MMMPAMLLVAVLGASPQEPPAPAPSPRTQAQSKPAKPARKAGGKASRATPRPAAAPAAEAASAAPAGAGSAEDAIQAGLAAFARKRFAQAKASFEQAVEADPQNAAAHFYLGYTIYKIAEPRTHDSAAKHEAAEHFAKAYELDPNFKPVWGPHKG
jgi:tetratricopeptide (TPR) repeat protein